MRFFMEIELCKLLKYFHILPHFCLIFDLTKKVLENERTFVRREQEIKQTGENLVRPVKKIKVFTDS